MKQYADKQLVNKALFGDEKSLEVLIQKYLKPVFNFVYTYVGDKDIAEDLTQEVFVKVWKNLKKFDGQKKFKTWLFTIAKNTAIDFLRKKKTIPFSTFDNLDGSNIILDSVANDISLSKSFEEANNSEIIFSNIKKLSNIYQKIIKMRFQNQLTFKEISLKTNESINTVKSRYRRAVAILQKLTSK